MVEPINNTAKAVVWNIKPHMRRYWPHGSGTGKPSILQQLWECPELGIIEWRDIPNEFPR
jgi:hypothetical protein